MAFGYYFENDFTPVILFCGFIMLFTSFVASIFSNPCDFKQYYFTPIAIETIGGLYFFRKGALELTKKKSKVK